MNTEQFKYILAVAEYKNFTKAANALYVTQPYLSKLVSSIETELGATLFERSNRILNLTPAGIVYLNYIKSYLSAEQKMRTSIRELENQKIIELKVGIPISHGSYILPQIMQQFKQLYPHVHVILEEHSNQTLIDYALNSVVDLCCFSSLDKNERLDYEVISREKIMLVMPPSSPLGKIWSKGNYMKPPIFPLENMDLLNDEDFILLSKAQGIGRYGRRILEKYNLHPHIVMETKNIETAYRLAVAGIGMTFIPQICAKFSNFIEEPYYYSLGNPPIEREFVIAYAKGRKLTSVEKDFISIAKSV